MSSEYCSSKASSCMHDVYSQLLSFKLPLCYSHYTLCNKMRSHTLLEKQSIGNSQLECNQHYVGYLPKDLFFS